MSTGMRPVFSRRVMPQVALAVLVSTAGLRAQTVPAPPAAANGNGSPAASVAAPIGQVSVTAGRSTIVNTTFDVTRMASGERATIEEIGLYTVNKDDKINREQFFYDGPH